MTTKIQDDTYITPFRNFESRTSSLSCLTTSKCFRATLNDYLLKESDTTTSLAGQFCRFPGSPIALTANIEEMILQVRVHVSERGPLRFMWWVGDQLDGITSIWCDFTSVLSNFTLNCSWLETSVWRKCHKSGVRNLPLWRLSCVVTNSSWYKGVLSSNWGLSGKCELPTV